MPTLPDRPYFPGSRVELPRHLGELNFDFTQDYPGDRGCSLRYSTTRGHLEHADVYEWCPEGEMPRDGCFEPFVVEEFLETLNSIHGSDDDGYGYAHVAHMNAGFCNGFLGIDLPVSWLTALHVVRYHEPEDDDVEKGEDEGGEGDLELDMSMSDVPFLTHTFLRPWGGQLIKVRYTQLYADPDDDAYFDAEVSRVFRFVKELGDVLEMRR